MNDNAPMEEAKGWREWLRRNSQMLYGFFGWYVINSIIWLLINPDPGTSNGYYVIVNVFIFPINLLALVFLSAKPSTRKIAMGILIALALNLLLSLVVGLGMNGICFIPFFVN